MLFLPLRHAERSLLCGVGPAQSVDIWILTRLNRRIAAPDEVGDGAGTGPHGTGSPSPWAASGSLRKAVVRIAGMTGTANVRLEPAGGPRPLRGQRRRPKEGVSQSPSDITLLVAENLAKAADLRLPDGQGGRRGRHPGGYGHAPPSRQPAAPGPAYRRRDGEHRRRPRHDAGPGRDVPWKPASRWSESCREQGYGISSPRARWASATPRPPAPSPPSCLAGPSRDVTGPRRRPLRQRADAQARGH